MQRHLASLPHRVEAVREVQKAPLQKLLLFVHRFGDDIGLQLILQCIFHTTAGGFDGFSREAEVSQDTRGVAADADA